MAAVLWLLCYGHCAKAAVLWLLCGRFLLPQRRGCSALPLPSPPAALDAAALGDPALGVAALGAAAPPASLGFADHLDGRMQRNRRFWAAPRRHRRCTPGQGGWSSDLEPMGAPCASRRAPRSVRGDD